jgi:hypothetical protein
MKFRWMPLLGLLACSDEAAPSRMSLEVEPRLEADSEAFEGRLAVGWVEGNELLVDAIASRPFEDGSTTLELAGEPAVDDARGRRLRFGVLAAIDAQSGDVVKLSPARPTVSTFRVDGQPERRVETWCDIDPASCAQPGGCGDVHELCYQEIFQCSRVDARDCELVSTNGDAVHGNRFGHLHGLAENYVVVHASEAVSAYEVARQGLYVGPLAAGYHLVRGRALEGQELADSRACWKQATSFADLYRAGMPTGAMDVDALLASELAHDNLYDDSWAGLRLLIGTVGLQCPYRHVRYEVVAAEQVRIEVRMSRLARPLFRFMHPARDL